MNLTAVLNSFHCLQSPINSRSFMASRSSFSTESSLGQAFTEMYIYKGEDVAGKTIVIPLSKNQYGPASKRVSSKAAKQAEGQTADSQPSGAGPVKQIGIAATLSSAAAGGRPGLLITKPLTKEVNHVSFTNLHNTKEQFGDGKISDFHMTFEYFGCKTNIYKRKMHCSNVIFILRLPQGYFEIKLTLEHLETSDKVIVEIYEI